MDDIKIAKTIDSKRVLITETDLNNKNKPVKYYVVPQENADCFIRSKKSLNGIDVLQKAGSALIGVLVGISAYQKLKTPLPRVLNGIIAGIGTYEGAVLVNKTIDRQTENNLFYRTGGYELTDDKEKSKLL